MLLKRLFAGTAMETLRKLLLASATLVMAGGIASAKELNAIGVSLGSLGNPFFIAMGKGVEAKAKEINPEVKITTVSSDYDLNKQFSQMDNFIASGMDLILLNAADAKAIAPAVKRAQAAGIVVVAIDVAAAGADATIQTDNVKAGQIACQYLVDKIGNKGGKIVIMNGPQVSSIIDRVNGCKDVLAKAGGLEVLSDDLDGKVSRDGGLALMQSYLTRFPHIDGLFTINDPEAVGADLAAKQLGRSEMIITSVDGAPEIEAALKSNTLIQASAGQDPYQMAIMAVEIGNNILQGKMPDSPVTLIAPHLLTRDNVQDYKGWGSH